METNSTPTPGTLDALRALVERFSHLPGDTPVILQKDPEGNGYSPLADAEECLYVAETTYSGEAYMTPEALSRAIAREGSQWTEEDAAPEEAVRAVCLEPVN